MKRRIRWDEQGQDGQVEILESHPVRKVRGKDGSPPCLAGGVRVAVILIGGSGRGAGKTAVGCALVRAWPGVSWTVLKVSPHTHVEEEIWEENDPHSEKDTGRYLAAGAKRAFLVSDGDGLGGAEFLEGLLSENPEGVILVESNRGECGILGRQDGRSVCLGVAAGDTRDWKSSFWARVERFDALVLTGGLTVGALPAGLREKRTFVLGEGVWSSEEFVEFVRERLGSVRY